MAALSRLACCASLFLIASASLAQTQPYEAPRRPYGDEYYNSALSGADAYNMATGYPAAEVRAVPAAELIAAAARAEYNVARSELHAGVTNAVKRFERSVEMRQAVEAEKQAWTRYESARSQALQPLADDENYQAHLALQRRLGAQIKQQHANPDAPVEQIHAAAQVKLEQSVKASAREEKQLNAEPQVADAKARLREAHQRASTLREQFGDQVRDDPALVQARQNMRQARVAHLAAVAQLQAVLDARDIALDYAYWLYSDEHGRSRYARQFGGYGGSDDYYDNYGGYSLGYAYGWPSRGGMRRR